MMNNIENFITSPIDPQPRPGFKSTALEKTLAAYQQSGQRHWARYAELFGGLVVGLAFCLIVVLRISSLNGQQSTKRDVAQIDEDTQSLEKEISQDPVLAEAAQLPN